MDEELNSTQFLEQSFHLRLGVKVARSPGGGDAIPQHLLGFLGSLSPHQRLSCHEVARGVVGMVLEQNGEFRHGAIQVSLLRVFHGKPVTGESIVRVLGENVVERGDTIHGTPQVRLLQMAVVRGEAANKLTSDRATQYNVGSDQTFPRIMMACPFFMPMEKLVNGTWPHAARLPLGCGWSGHCTASGHEGDVPAQEAQENFCNLGYAAACGWLPAQRSWDAVRFAVIAQESRARNSTIQLHYVCERNHLPIEHGRLTFDGAGAVWMDKHPDHRVQKMAECFLESWMAKGAMRSADSLAS